MTSPGPGPAVNTPYTLTPGTPAQKITDGAGNSPAGCQLINPGSHGGTVWLTAGPTSAGAIPLGPGASMVWTDPAVLPYAFLSAAATAVETLLVTSQAASYSNPAAVAAATATQLAAQGIPSTMLDTDYGTYRISAGLGSVPLTVGSSASLVVQAAWPQPSPVGANVLRLTFSDPSSPSLTPVSVSLSADNAVDGPGTQYTWIVPVIAPALVLTNVSPADHNNADAFVSVIGNNRLTPRVRQLGDELGAHLVWKGATWASGVTQALAGYMGASNLTKFTGPVTLTVQSASGAGMVTANWVDAFGNRISFAFPVAAGNTLVQNWIHPPIPVAWSWNPSAAYTGNVFLFLTG